LHAKKALNTMQSGQILKIVATDPGSVKDFQAFCKQTGNELVSSEIATSEFIFFMKKK
jgi:tRNA 2-thiouridine synthesizing protein A